MNDSNKMTRAELEAWYVERGVARWGEAERDGLAKQAARKSLATLRGDYDLAQEESGKMTAQEVMDRAEERETGSRSYQAQHCNQDGPT